MKLKFSQEEGISLITIPFWWDKSLSSLAATIHQQRPDLVPSAQGSPIPLEMPKQYQVPTKYSPNVPQKYHDNVDPTGWYLPLFLS
jgi:hypothetical protein